jgi:hypothetical protein
LQGQSRLAPATATYSLREPLSRDNLTGARGVQPHDLAVRRGAFQRLQRMGCDRVHEPLSSLPVLGFRELHNRLRRHSLFCSLMSSAD